VSATTPAADTPATPPATTPASPELDPATAAALGIVTRVHEAPAAEAPPAPEPSPEPPSAEPPSAEPPSAEPASTEPPGAVPPVPPAARPPRWRGRVLPKTALGLAALILAAAVGSAFSGVVLYAYYEYRLNKTDARVSNFITTEGRNLANAQSQINAERDKAIADIRAELAPLQSQLAQGQTLQNLIKQVSPTVFFIHTLDEAGQPSVGSAFVVASDADQSLLLTSYTTIRAATHNPRPDVFARQGATETKVTVWTWEPQRDLALLILPKGNLPHLSFIPVSPPLQVGERVFAVSGLGSSGAAVTQGFISDVSAAGIQHNAAVAPAFQGGPLVDSDGNVMAVASRAYAPLNFATDSVWFGVPIRAACEKVLKCPAGDAAAAPGDRLP
jgi:S1-C subfamily serine protease